jgi:hypothetical protein
MFRYLFITFGLVLVVINIVILWIMAALTPDRFQIDGWLSLVLAGILILIFGAFFETLMGLQPPIEDHGPTVRTREQLFSLGSAPIYVPTHVKPEPETEVGNVEAIETPESTEAIAAIAATEAIAAIEAIEATE